MRVRDLKPIGVIVVILAFLPAIVRFNNYYVLLLTWILYYSTLVSAWNIIGGFAGQLDLAAASYIGLGAYTMGTLMIRYGLTPWIGIPAGGLVAVAFAVLVGYPTFRFGLREAWYALATISSVVVLQKLFLVWESVGGPEERYLPPYYGSIYYLRFRGYTPYYYILLATLALTLILNVKIRRSKMGYYLLAIKENEEAAEILGVDVRKYKLKALMTYAFVTGCIGGIFALISGYLHPHHFGTWTSLQVAILGIVGGAGAGAIFSLPVTTFIIYSISEVLRSTLGGWIPGIHLIFYGVILMVVVLLKPEGLAETYSEFYGRIKGALTKKAGGIV